MARRALVTGATGLVGSHIVEQLVRDGWDVRGLVRDDLAFNAVRAAGAEPVRGDVLDRASLLAASDGVDVILHTAAAITESGGWESYRRLNIDGTAMIIEACEQAGARLLQLSSVAVYGPTFRYDDSGNKTSEDTPLGPLPDRSFYARSKRESEMMVMDAHRAGRIWATAVRPSVIYGRRDRQFVPRMAGLLKTGLMPAIGGGRSTLSVVHAANVADGAIKAVTSDRAGGRPYNLANDFEVTVREFFSFAGDGLGKHIRFVPVPMWLARSGLLAFRAFDRVALGGKFAVASEGSLSFLSRDNPFTSERARTELGWSPRVSPSEGVPDAFRWWATNHR